ncbi:RING-H2 finger protein ATL64-like [Abrus precatorius]|uniref:RING-H2 finger protein ATL64-like n=1 Tax=Abrus precatorius TaxID=3816 RepID=A0A8B8L5M0_ABRPR|nr:RING-H2 finger protein ATL64-like [Abrus precatorius]
MGYSYCEFERAENEREISRNQRATQLTSLRARYEREISRIRREIQLTSVRGAGELPRCETTTLQFQSVRDERVTYRPTLPPPTIFTDDCTICMEQLQNGESIQPSRVCVHQFHSSCIRTWLEMGYTTCPLCRKNFIY